MSIDDDYYDIEDALGKPMADTWERLSQHFKAVELDNENLRKRNGELELTVKTMMGIRDQGKHDWVCSSPGMYDATYTCRKCCATHTESADDPSSVRPEGGCSK